ncbi:hypothetical protein Psch_02647 [Pelotomaculum schinkii]|uniref:Defence against restriction A C-terminal domain-containing protein n=1 Tax=Pelotomaculum schinkii TaxID=78350 RepID=A0A4Y7RA11_9FIRM|nr:hypothetical protein [Pelotomaculum schinkii]TEB05606.1 hypothetical protein Psch_02647 [Pelotomaculum schinkii]
MSDNPSKEKVHGYEIKRSVLFDNDRGFALAENPNAPQPFVTWQFTEENGKRDYYWGHYTTNKAAAIGDYENRVSEYQHDYGVSEKLAYKYYSTQRPVDIGTFPKTENGPLRLVNFDKRENVEQGHFQAWGYLIYDAPLTGKQMGDYELRAAPDNPDQLRLSPEQLEQQVQTVGKWEQAKRIPDVRRLTWWYPDFGSFVKKEFVTDAELSGRYEKIMDSKARNEKKPISERLKEGAEQAARDNAARPAPSKNTEKDR